MPDAAKTLPVPHPSRTLRRVGYRLRKQTTALLSLASLSITTAAFAQTAPPASKHAAPATTTPWTRIPIPPLHDFHPTQPKKIVLANGLTIFLQPDRELPFINGSLLIRGGSRDEPADKVGLISLYGQAWRTSGTSTNPGDTLDELLALKAADIETGGGLASTSLSWSSFKQDFDQVFSIALDLLLHPDFKADKLALGKQQLAAGIARRNDDAAGIAGREAAQIAYGKSSPYARETEYSTIAAVQLADFTAWHNKTVVPNNMILAVSGDFDAADMEAKLRKAFEAMPRGTEFVSARTEFQNPAKAVNFVNKPDVNQSNVYIVGLGTERSNPDFFALQVMNQIFSGGFGSRILQSVRTRLGLAYSVGGAFGAAYDHPGTFTVAAATKSSSTVAATEAMLTEIERLKTVPPTAAELRSAKDQVLNSFIFNYDSRDKTLNEQVTLAFYGYPADYLDRYKTAIENVTSADVTRVATKYIDTSKLAIVVVGNQSEFGTPLSKLGPVTNLDVTIPPPPK
jgi:zinc protease